MYRQKDSLLPIQYYNRLPKNESCDVAFIVDPCIGMYIHTIPYTIHLISYIIHHTATSNTLNAVVSILKKWGAKRIVVVACVGAKEGVDRLLEQHPSVEVCVWVWYGVRTVYGCGFRYGVCIVYG